MFNYPLRNYECINAVYVGRFWDCLKAGARFPTLRRDLDKHTFIHHVDWVFLINSFFLTPGTWEALLNYFLLCINLRIMVEFPFTSYLCYQFMFPYPEWKKIPHPCIRWKLSVSACFSSGDSPNSFFSPFSSRIKSAAVCFFDQVRQISKVFAQVWKEKERKRADISKKDLSLSLSGIVRLISPAPTYFSLGSARTLSAARSELRGHEKQQIVSPGKRVHQKKKCE